MQRWSLLLATLVFGCDVSEGPPTERRGAALPCRSDGACGSGSCLISAGICNTPTGTIDTLLFEIAPQATDPEYGNSRLYSYRSGLARSTEDPLVLNIPERVAIQGQVDATPEQDGCTGDATSLPVMLVFTPRERLFGISVPTYSFETSFVDDGVTNEFRFRGTLPAGRYDVYMRPRPTRALPPACNLAPQIFRDVAVELQTTLGTTAAPLTPVQQSLRLTMRWREDLEGWNVDMVHPVTGEVISTRTTLRGSRVVDYGQGPVIEFTLHYSVGGAKDFIQAGEELVRLTPPANQASTAGTVLLQREGLELVTPGEGTIGDVTTFGAPIAFQSWIWPVGEIDSPVVGTVSFAATSLTEVVGGVSASFTGSDRVDALGQVKFDLLPGDYRLRVVPSPDAGLAASEFKITLQSGTPTQQGRIIYIPRAARLEGSVKLVGSEVPVPGVEIVLTGSEQPIDGCAPGASSTDPFCTRPRAKVLQRALGEDPFVPRIRGALTEGDGSFEVDEIDCGACNRGDGAGFDLALRPPAESGLPWALKPAVRVDGDRDLGALHLSAPVTRPVHVTFGGQSSDDRLPGALVTAYVLLDADSKPVQDPANVPPCLGAKLEGTLCIQSAVPIAEGRSDSNGELLLLLPPSLE